MPLGQENNAKSIEMFALRRYNRIKNTGEKIMDTQLNEKERELLVLEIVDACIQYSKEHTEDFEEVLHQQVFANEAYIEFMEMVCKTIESLHTKGYIEGTVELAYEPDTEDIDFFMTSFENINISLKGKEFMSGKTFKEVSENFWEKSKPLVRCIASTVLQTTVETITLTGLRAVGIPV